MHVYLGLFMLTFSTLAFQVTLTRILSVVTWYHLAFFAISCGMLGMTAGAVSVYLNDSTLQGSAAHQRAARACLHFSAAVPAALVFLCLVPFSLYGSVMSVVGFLCAVMACSVPFYFSGMAVALVLTKSELPIGRLYAADMLGAALGCLFVLAGLNFLDAPSFVVFCAAGGALAALLLDRASGSVLQKRAAVAAIGLAVLAAVNAQSARGIRPVFVKNRFSPAPMFQLERWNSFSRVALSAAELQPPQYWGPSRFAPTSPILQAYLHIDGEASTTARRFHQIEDLAHLRYDVTNIGWALGRTGPSCVIGLGGGRDVQAALLFGSTMVTAIDVNEIFVDLQRGELEDLTRLARRGDVRMIVDDARAYLARTPEQYDMIQMSLVDTWAATGAGAFSLSENSLYTVQAWHTFLDRLGPQGVLAVSRWYDPDNIGEMGRLATLGVAALLDLPVRDPAAHLALIASGRVVTLLAARSPFQATDIERLRHVSNELGFQVLYLPGTPPESPVLRSIVAADSKEALAAATVHPYYNFSAPTDDSPYFFNMLRLRGLAAGLAAKGGVIHGNLVATATLGMLLVALTLCTAMTVVLPLAYERRAGILQGPRSRRFWAGAVYFALIGSGFMFLEIVLIQRLALYLGHPVYALGILLFSLIASTGMGSLISDLEPLRTSVAALPLVMTVAIAGAKAALDLVVGKTMASSLPIKIALAVVVIFPLGLLLGQFFPAGMRMAGRAGAPETPWYWAINGVFGVLSSAVAVLVSVHLSLSANFWIAGACYAGLLVPLRVLVKRAAEPSV